MKRKPDNSQGREILLLFPPLQECIYGDKWKPTESFTAPLGLMYLATPLIRAGYHLKFIDFTVDLLEKEQYHTLVENADFILISCYTQTLMNVKRIINEIKVVNKYAFIICGGPYCSETENHVEGSDLTVYGEADFIIVKILDLISSGVPSPFRRESAEITP